MSNYLLKQGNHYASGLHFGVHFGITEQKYRVKFSKECLYTPLDWENDWNKLCGWSYGLHHKNSIRVCWRPFIPTGVDYRFYTPSQIELCIYVYEDSVRKISEQTILVNTEEYIELGLNAVYHINPEYGAIITLTNYSHVHDSGGTWCAYQGYDTKPSWGYFLYPYFGGNAPSPHNMNIELERL